MKRVLASAVLGLALAVLPAGAAGGHPLGNFTVNTALGLRIGMDQVGVDLVVDMAEIPTIQARRGIDADGDGEVGAGEAPAYAGRACADAAARIELTVDERRVPLRPASSEIDFPAGDAGLPTLRLTCALVAETDRWRGEREVAITSRAFTDRVGWREITAIGDRATLVASTVATTSPSARLTTYPDNVLSSPPDQRAATVRARPGGPPAPVVDGVLPGAGVVEQRGLDGATRRFTSLVARQQLTAGFAVLAFAVAVGLGAVHAFAPGHGKTLMAAYLVGQRGSLRQAAAIGATVTATHTAGVLLLGVALSASTSLAPERAYPWLGLASGLLLTGVGAGMVLRATGRRPQLLPAGHGHTHGPGHAHSHSHEDHGHEDHGHGHGPRQWRSLVPLGLAGGLVPSPSAIVVLLGAMAVGRAWFGVALVIAYGLGMAATLTGAGIALVTARDTIERRLARPGAGKGPLATVVGRLPIVTAACIVAGGLLLAARGAGQL